MSTPQVPHIKENVHPEAGALQELWRQWRLTYEGGDEFIDEFLIMFSDREDPNQFAKRKKITYLPAFAKESVNDVRNAIYERTSDVTREGGSQAYMDAIKGKNGGIDFRGRTMNAFMMQEVLQELVVLAKVGVYVDMPPKNGPSMLSNIGRRPYMYAYRAEDILNWNTRRNQKGSDIEYTALLLRDWHFAEDEATGLAGEAVATYRLYRLTDNGKVSVKIYTDTVPTEDEPDLTESTFVEEIILDIPRIPFVVMELSDSLLKDIMKYQAALMNLASGDMHFLTEANFSFIIEQFDPRIFSPHLEGPRGPNNDGTAEFNQHDHDVANNAHLPDESNPGQSSEEVQRGPMRGRRYPKGLDGPSYIHPSAEPVLASMRKQDIMKNEVRELLSLSLSNIKPRMASAEAKQMDERGLESGLSGIALAMELGERKIASFWAMYETNTDVATIKYPERYALRSTADRREEIKELRETKKDVPSELGRKAISKKIIDLSVGNLLSDKELEEINKEVDESDFSTGDPETVQTALDKELVSRDVAARALGFPGGKDAETAKKEHAERAAAVAEAQASIKSEPRGVPAIQTDPTQQQKDDKQDD